MSGSRSYFAGISAEQAATEHYRQRGFRVMARRWRGAGGEIDLIVENDTCIVFVEVKTSRTTARAAARISPQQLARICASAEEFMSRRTGNTPRDFRIDAALVDGWGRVEILENVSLD